MKKTLLCLFLLVAGAMNAQIVNIPDAEFKFYLLGNNLNIDTNNDGEIQVSEAGAVTSLEVYDDFDEGGFTSIEGIEAFSNLTELHLYTTYSTDLQNVDVSALSNLQNLEVSMPNVSDVNINISGLTELNVINIEADTFSLIDLSGLTNVTKLYITASTLPPLDFSDLQNVQELGILFNNNNNLTFGTHPYLTNLVLASFDNIANSAVDFTSFPALETLTLQKFNITGFNIFECGALKVLDIKESTGPEILDLTLLNNLEAITIENSEIQNINIGTKLNLINVTIDTTPMRNLDLSGCPNITYIYLAEDGPDSIDYLLNVKNGNIAVHQVYGDNIANLNACIDEGDEILFYINGSTLSTSTYCTFTPGGDYNTIAGTVSFDGNNNGCDTSDAVIHFGSISITDGTVTGTSLTSTGNYNFYTQAGTFTLTPQFENDWFTAAPETVTFANNNDNTATQNFCVTANGTHNDAEVTVVPIITAQPGFDAPYKILYKNKGNQTLSGTVNFTYDDAVLDYVSASPVETSAGTGSLSWNYANLLPFESRTIYVTLNVNSPMETPAVNIDDVLPFTVSITPTAADESPVDNSFTLNQTVVGSYDPNDITCLEGATVNPEKIGEYLHYNINFENTGTAPATFVVVKDLIDVSKFDVNSLVVLNASHDMETRITGNKVEFIFDNINLAANGGKGNVTFKIKSLETLAINSSVTQKADIFFDYNWPIVTNEAVTTYAVLNNPAFTKDASVKVYPNPANNVVSISSESNIQSLQLFDVQGRLLEAATVNDISGILDIASRAKGIYFIKIATEKGMNVEKLVKE